MKFLHTMINVTDIEKSLKFYQEVLDLKVDRTLEFPGATLYFLKDSNGYELELSCSNKIPENGYIQNSFLGHLAFEVDNFDKFSQKLKDLDCIYVREPFVIPGTELKIAFIKDPDGITIELIEKNY